MMLSMLNVEAICDTHIKVSGGREEEVGKEREKEMLRWLLPFARSLARPRPLRRLHAEQRARGGAQLSQGAKSRARPPMS